MTAQPRRAFLFVDRLERATDRVLAHDLLHVEQLGQHAVAAQRRDMGVALAPARHRQHRRAQNIPLLRRVRAHITQRTIRYQRIKQPARLQIMNEERQLSERRHRRLVVPLHPHRTDKAVHFHPWRRRRALQLQIVHPQGEAKSGRIMRHAPEFARFSCRRKVRNAGSRLKRSGSTYPSEIRPGRRGMGHEGWRAVMRRRRFELWPKLRAGLSRPRASAR